MARIVKTESPNLCRETITTDPSVTLNNLKTFLTGHKIIVMKNFITKNVIFDLFKDSKIFNSILRFMY